MSPEQIKGLPPDNRSDLWAMGCLIYEMLTGTHPFTAPSFEAVANRVLNETPPPPSQLRPEIGSDLDYMVLKLLRKDPAHRYSRAEDLIADLANCCALAEPAAPSPPATPRVAVLYFDVLSASPDDAFVAAGLAEDLIVDLTRLEGVTVASRADVQAFRDRAVPPRTLARELGVDYVVQGSVRRAGQRARISAQLVRASDGHTMWAERFDRTLEDLFEVQAEVSSCIVQALQVALKPGEREMLDKVPTRSREAYAHYLNARTARCCSSPRTRIFAPVSCSSPRWRWIPISPSRTRRWARRTRAARCSGGPGSSSEIRRWPARNARSRSSRTSSKRSWCVPWCTAFAASTGSCSKCWIASSGWIPRTSRRWTSWGGAISLSVVRSRPSRPT